MANNESGYHIFHFKGTLPSVYQKELTISNDINFLKEPLKKVIRSLYIDLDSDIPLCSELNKNNILNTIIIREFFIHGSLSQIYFAIPIDNISPQRNESVNDYRLRIKNESTEKLVKLLGNHYKSTDFIHTSSFVWVLDDERDFNDNRLSYKTISLFLTNSYKLQSDQYEKLDHSQFIVDSSGIGIIFQSGQANYFIINRMIFLVMLAKSYIASLESISLGVLEPLQESLDFFEEAKMIEKKLDEYNRFLVKYYYHNPIAIDLYKSYTTYQSIKNEFNMETQHLETIEQLKLLGEIARIKRRQIAEFVDSERQQEKKEIMDFVQQHTDLIIKRFSISYFIIIVMFAFIVYKVFFN